MSRSVYPFPVLSSESVDYRNNRAYKVEVSRDAKNIKVRHSLEDDSIVANFIKEGKACFACFLSIPRTLHRKTYCCEGSKLEVSQEIPFPSDDFAGKVFVRPSIVCREDLKINNFDSLSDFYGGSPINVPKGGILGFSNWVTISSAYSKLFKIKNDPEFDSSNHGIFKSDFSTTEGFQIVVTMGKDLYNKVVSSAEGLREYILCSALASAFTELKMRTINDSKGENDQEDGLLAQAKGLKELLESKDIKTWEDEDFNPVKAASSLKPASSNE